MKSKFNLRQIMQTARAFATSSAQSTGHSTKSHFSRALKQAWAEAKTPKKATIEEVVAKIKAINPAYGPYAEGGYIKGYYRGKTSEGYKIAYSSQTIVFDKAGISRIMNQIF